MVAHAPGHGALLTGGAGLVGLALDAQVHDVVPKQGTHCQPCNTSWRLRLCQSDFIQLT